MVCVVHSPVPCANESKKAISDMVFNDTSEVLAYFRKCILVEHFLMDSLFRS